MGPLAHGLAVLGLLAGYIVAKLAKSELKLGEKYFILLQNLLAAGILGTIIWNYNHWASALAILFFLILWKFSFKHQIIPMSVVLGVLSTYFSIDVLIFLYFIPTGTLYQENWKTLLLSAALYLIALAIGTIF